jgi:hypothetical protein
MRGIIGSFFALTVVTTGSLGAQQPVLPTGARVRVHAVGDAASLIGTVAYQSPSQLAVIRSPGDTAIVSAATISRVEVSAGRRSNALRGAKIGSISGATIGALLGAAALAMEEGSFFDYGAEVIPLSMIGGGLFGGAVGLLIGAASSSERWVPAGGVIAVRPAGGGIALSATFTF